MVLFDGKNTHGGFLGFERSFLHIQIIGENKQAFVILNPITKTYL